jgi:uncharacterized membrane protein SirB2
VLAPCSVQMQNHQVLSRRKGRIFRHRSDDMKLFSGMKTISCFFRTLKL